jgi:hypothetical protein
MSLRVPCNAMALSDNNPLSVTQEIKRLFDARRDSDINDFIHTHLFRVP